jgi:hypothetical protein
MIECFHANISEIPFARVPARNNKGALTRALNQALVCLPKNAFGTPSTGRAPKAAFGVKLPVSIQAAAEAANCLCF